MDNWLNIIPITFILAGSMVVFVGDNWRHTLISLALIFAGLFFLYLQVWDLVMSAAKLVTGGACIAVLSFITSYQEAGSERGTTAKRIFKGLALLMAWIIGYLLAAKVGSIFKISPEIAFTAFALMGCGLLQLGMTSIPFKVIIGILTFFAGFELLYAALESSLLVNGLILVVDMLIAFIGAYMIRTTAPGENE